MARLYDGSGGRKDLDKRWPGLLDHIETGVESTMYGLARAAIQCAQGTCARW